MASRPIWRGHLRLALVSCPVALYAARHDRGSVRFNMINPSTGNRIRMKTVDAETEEEISRSQTIKGYEYSKGRYVTITDEDLEAVRVESSKMMSIEKFVDAASIDPIYYDASYYLAPDGKGAEDVYAVVREAIARTGRVALTRVVIAQRERTVAVRTIEDGLVAHTLNEQRDLNESGTLFDAVRDIAIDPSMIDLAIQLIDRQTADYDPADLEDRYETRLREMLDAKVKGEALEQEVDQPFEGNVVDIMAALRRSLGQAPEPKVSAAPAKSKRPSRSEPGKRAQTALKLPIAGGKSEETKDKAARVPVARSGGGQRRKAS